MYKIEALQSKTDELIYKVNDYFLHSKYDPIREAKKFADKNYQPHVGHILFGYGAGHIVDALIERFEHNEIVIIIDPLIGKDGLKVQERHKDLPILDESYEENLHGYLMALIDHFRWSFNVICSPNYDKIFPNEYLEILKKVKSYQSTIIINDATIVRYQKEWHVNVMNNMMYLPKDKNVSTLKNKYNAPVIVVAGGPSLEKQLDYLKQIQSKVLMIAAGTTINTLLSAGIEPHYVVTIDGSERNSLHFSRVESENVQMIYALQTHQKVRENFKGKCYYTGALGYEDVNRYLEKKTQQKIPLLDSGGSVAHISFALAQYISSGPVALIGQDLAYTNDLTHAPNNLNCMKITKEFLESKKAFQIDEYNGGKVWTTPALDSMRVKFEFMIEEFPPNRPFYNCTEGGALIKGYENMPLKEFCEKYISDDVHLYNPEDENLLTTDFIENLLNEEIIIYKKIIKLLEEALIQLKLNKSTVQFESVILRKLEKIDKEVDLLLKDVLLELLTGPLKIEILRCFLAESNETPEQQYKRIFNQNLTLYTKLKEAAEFALQCNEQVLERMRRNNNE